MPGKKPTYDELAEKVKFLEEGMKSLRNVREKLEESENKFRTLVDSTPIAVLIYREDRWIFVNRAAEEISGYTERELINKNYWEIIHPDFVEMVRERGQRRQQGESIGRYEMKIIRKDGSEKWISVSGASTTIGKKTAGVVSLIDIDDYKRAEAAIKASEDKFRGLFDNAVEGVFHTTLQGRLLEANKAWARMFRYPSVEDALNEITDITHQLYVDPADRTKALYLLKKKGYITEYECRLYRRDKTIFWAVMNARLATPLPDGTPCIQGFIANINRRKIAEEVLKESEERFRLLVEHAPDGIFVQTNSQFAYVNKAAAKMFGSARPSAMIGQPVLGLMHPDYREVVLERMRRLNADRKAAPVLEQKYLRLDGAPFDVEVSAVPILYGGEEGALVFFRDISDRKRAEEERERLLNELKEALAKVKVLGGFLPICAWCKKIRDDKGYWNQIESYIREHSEAEFSHSICPECMEKLKKNDIP